MIYLVILFLLLILSFRYDIVEKKKYRDHWYLFVLILLILIAGLRWRLGVDTPNSLYRFYHGIKKLSELAPDDLSIGSNPIWTLLNSFVLSFGGKFYHLQLIQSSLTNCLFFHYFRKHSHYIFTCVLFYYIYIYLGMNMEAMKASMSIAVCLYANDYLIEKKWIKAYGLYVLAVFFHAQAILLLITPFFLFLRLNKKGILLMIATFFIGLTMDLLLGTYLDMIDLIGDDDISRKSQGYSSQEKYISGNPSLIGTIVRVYPYIIYPIICIIYLKIKDNSNFLHKLEPFIMLGILCVIMMLHVRIFYRYVDHYAIYFILLFSQVFNLIAKRSIKLSYGVRPFKSFVYFAPLIFCMLAEFSKDTVYVRYFPYSSVIERHIDKEREKFYMDWNRPTAKDSEY